MGLTVALLRIVQAKPLTLQRGLTAPLIFKNFAVSLSVFLTSWLLLCLHFFVSSYIYLLQLTKCSKLTVKCHIDFFCFPSFFFFLYLLFCFCVVNTLKSTSLTLPSPFTILSKTVMQSAASGSRQADCTLLNLQRCVVHLHSCKGM